MLNEVREVSAPNASNSKKYFFLMNQHKINLYLNFLLGRFETLSTTGSRCQSKIIEKIDFTKKSTVEHKTGLFNFLLRCLFFILFKIILFKGDEVETVSLEFSS